VIRSRTDPCLNGNSSNLSDLQEAEEPESRRSDIDAGRG
jgi:hypothetical protein